MTSSRRPPSGPASFFYNHPISLPPAIRRVLPGHVDNDDIDIDLSTMLRASFRGGPHPGAFMVDPTLPEEPSLPPQQQQGRGGPHGEDYDYFPSGPSFMPFSPSDYNLPAAVEGTGSTSESAPPSPPSGPAFAYSPFLWPAEQHHHHHHPPLPQPVSSQPLHAHHHHYHHHHPQQHQSQHQNQHQRSQSILSKKSLRPTLSRSTRASHDTLFTDPPSDASSERTEFTADRFDNVVDSMDSQTFNESGDLLFAGLGFESSTQLVEQPDTASRGGHSSRSQKRSSNRGAGSSPNASWLAKLQTYSNSRLPPNLPRLHLYMPTWPLLCLAAQFSHRAYSKPAAAERETYIEADARGVPRTMVLKSVALDHMNVIVFAIRGSTLSFRDWATNMDCEPSAPTGFLDDVGNLCHAGFLSVARQMVRPLAARLQQMLEENPSRGSCSLIITGHSAGGAVASLLFAHMLSQNLSSELIDIRQSFKRVHCVTFGAPPVSLLALDKPPIPKFDKWLFFSFINEGDPVSRAEMPYVRSLLDLYNSAPPQQTGGGTSGNGLPLKLGFLAGNKDRHQNDLDKTKGTKSKPIWKVPSPTLTLPGRLILLRKLRDPKSKRGDKTRIGAHMTDNDALADVVFGDLLMHPMKLYEHRIQVLATDAVTAKFAG